MYKMIINIGLGSVKRTVLLWQACVMFEVETSN